MKYSRNYNINNLWSIWDVKVLIYRRKGDIIINLNYNVYSFFKQINVKLKNNNKNNIKLKNMNKLYKNFKIIWMINK